MTKTKQERLASNIRLRLILAGSITMLITVFILFPYYREFIEKKSELNELHKNIIATETELEVERNNYRQLKQEYAKQADSDRKSIDAILPLEPRQTTIVRTLEDYTTKLSSPENPLLLKSINFNKPNQKESGDYVTLPIKVSINTTRENLINLLSYFEHSGTITADNTIARRLLDVKNIDIRIADQDSSLNNLDVELTLTSYLIPENKAELKK